MSYKEVRAKTGEDRDGKPFYKTIGRVMDTKNGPMLKLDTVPLGWDGWAYISDPKAKEEAAPARKQARRSGSDEYEDVPF